MALLNILEFPNPGLRKKAMPVKQVDDNIRQLIDDMLETMYEASGVGLAAPQINVQQRILVMDVSEEHDTPFTLINPEILSREGSEESEEGCLSVPGFTEKVTRAEKVTVRALDRHGATIEFAADELLAVCIQHEIDHLDGKLFVDYLSPLKRQRIRKKLEKARRHHTTDSSPRRGAQL